MKLIASERVIFCCCKKRAAALFCSEKNRHECVRAGDRVASSRLDVDHRALDHTMEACRWRLLIGSASSVSKSLEGFVDVGGQQVPERLPVDLAGLHHRRGVRIIDEGQQQML
jgi:hypothetical protein